MNAIWQNIDLTSSQRPVLQQEETIIYVANEVGLYSGKHKIALYQNGVVYLTSRRICYIDNNKPHLNSLALDLQNIDKLEFYAGFLKSSPKITIHYTFANVSLTSSFSSSPSPSSLQTAAKTGAKIETVHKGVSTSLNMPASLIPAKQRMARDWICPICTFTNQVHGPYQPDISSLSPCANCGMKPPKSLRPSSAQREASPYSGTSTNTSTNGNGQGELTTISKLEISSPNSEMTTQKRELATFACPRCTFLNHPAITTCEVCGAPLISRNLPPVLVTNENSDERGRSPVPTFGGPVHGSDDLSCKLSFRQGGEKQFLDKLRKTIAQRAWEICTKSPADTEDKKPRRRGAGIGGLQNREELIRNQNALTMSDAFEDLEALMARAKEMVVLAESFAHRLATAPASSSAASSTAAQLLLRESSTALGLTTPVVTKETVGKEEIFHAELARQIAEFLDSGILRNEGGAMTLVDLFAVYNRARRGSLISPADLRSACAKFDKLKLPVRLRSFKSGIVVVQDRSRTDLSIRNSLLSWIKERTVGASALDAADRFGWSVGIANEELEMAEEHGDLVRDVGIEGVKFFVNEISRWDYRAWESTLETYFSDISIS